MVAQLQEQACSTRLIISLGPTYWSAETILGFLAWYDEAHISQLHWLGISDPLLASFRRN
jgi:hypothetical protein